jgi:uncharacterized coiled-coil protein SlyX
MMLDDKLDQRFGPIEARIEKLEDKSSKAHKKFVDTGADVTRQKSEAEIVRSNDLKVITTAFKNVQEDLKEVKSAVTETKSAVDTKIVPAAQAAEKAANQANNKADAQNVSLDVIEKNSNKVAKWYNHPGLKVIINSIVSAIGAYLAAGGKLPGCH